MESAGKLRKAQTWFKGLHPLGQAALVGIFFLAIVGILWNATVLAEEVDVEEINPEWDLVSTWPAGPLAGIAPVIQSGEPDADGCVALVEGQVVDLVPDDDTSAFWLRAQPDDRVVLSWVTDTVEQRLLVPEVQLGNEFEPGRVTVTLAPRSDDAVARVNVARGSAQLCGVQTEADRSAVQPAGTAAETEFLSSWPSGPLAGIAPTVQNATVDDQGCVAVPDSSFVDLVPDAATSAVWLYADLGSQIQADWIAGSVQESLTIPERQLANEFEQGRVTLTLADAPANTTVRISAQQGDVRVCGVTSE